MRATLESKLTYIKNQKFRRDKISAKVKAEIFSAEYGGPAEIFSSRNFWFFIFFFIFKRMFKVNGIGTDKDQKMNKLNFFAYFL